LTVFRRSLEGGKGCGEKLKWKSTQAEKCKPDSTHEWQEIGEHTRIRKIFSSEFSTNSRRDLSEDFRLAFLGTFAFSAICSPARTRDFHRRLLGLVIETANIKAIT